MAAAFDGGPGRNSVPTGSDVIRNGDGGRGTVALLTRSLLALLSPSPTSATGSPGPAASILRRSLGPPPATVRPPSPTGDRPGSGVPASLWKISLLVCTRSERPSSEDRASMPSPGSKLGDRRPCTMGASASGGWLGFSSMMAGAGPSGPTPAVVALVVCPAWSALSTSGESPRERAMRGRGVRCLVRLVSPRRRLSLN